MSETKLDDAVDRAFSGYGMALRREDEPPIPGEPLMFDGPIDRRFTKRIKKIIPTERERIKSKLKDDECTPTAKNGLMKEQKS